MSQLSKYPLFLFFSLLFGAYSAAAQTFEAPVYDTKRTTKELRLTKVQVTAKYTICDMVYTNTFDSKNSQETPNYIYIISDMHLYDVKTQQKYYVIKTENIPMLPEKYGFKHVGESLRFRVYFPRIDPKKTFIFHILEDVDRGFKFYNVRLMPVA